MIYISNFFILQSLTQGERENLHLPGKNILSYMRNELSIKNAVSTINSVWNYKKANKKSHFYYGMVREVFLTNESQECVASRECVESQECVAHHKSSI